MADQQDYLIELFLGWVTKLDAHFYCLCVKFLLNGFYLKLKFIFLNTLIKPRYANHSLILKLLDD